MIGGQVTGSLDHGIKVRDAEERLRAISPDGLVIPVDEIKDDGSYYFGNLRPGKWHIVLGEENPQNKVIVEKEKTIKVPSMKEEE